MSKLDFCFFHKIKKKGLTAYCNKSFFKNFKFPKHIQWGIMINASDLINTPNGNDEKKIQTLKDLNKTNLSFVRIACHFYEVFKIEKYLKELKKIKI